MNEPGKSATQVAEKACLAHPGLSGSVSDFQAHLTALVDQGVGLEEIRASDLYLAWCCAQGCAKALECFWTDWVPVLRRAALSVTKDADLAEDVVQDVLHKLLVDTQEKPASISTYEGRSKLQRWLRSVAVRAALTARKKGSGSKLETEEEAERLPALDDDPELSLLKEQSGEAVGDALQAALRNIAPEQRLVLQQHLVDGLTIDELAKIYRIHRATAARHIARAREALLAATRSGLRARLQLTGSELDSLLDFAQSRVKLSLRWLAATGEPGLKAGESSVDSDK